MTDAIEDYVIKKINSVEKFFKGIIRAEVVVGMETHHHNKGEIFYVECRLEVPGKSVFAKETEKTLYKAVDAVRDFLEAELKKHKAKIYGDQRRKQVSGRDNKEYHEEE